jgi:CHASE3 domain sensor protein
LQNEILKIENNLIHADSLSINLLQIESDKRGFQLTNDVSYLRNYYKIKVSSKANLEYLKDNVIANSGEPILYQIDSLLKLRMGNLDSGIVVFTTKGFEASIEFMQLKGKKNIRDQLNQNLGVLKNSLLQKLQENTSIINKRSNNNLTGLLIILLIFKIILPPDSLLFKIFLLQLRGLRGGKGFKRSSLWINANTRWVLRGGIKGSNANTNK